MTLQYPSLSVLPSGLDFRLIPSGTTFSSPLSGRDQTQFLGGAKWKAVLDYATLGTDDWRLLSAFLTEMRGQSGRCFLGPLHAPRPQGSASGVPVISGINQIGTSLVTSGWPASQTGVLLPGDFLQVPTARGQQLLMVTQQVDSDAGGNATITFRPNLRSVATANGALQTNQPQTVMMLGSDDTSMDFKPPVLGSITLTFLEAIP